jgi:hypothetical protein
VDPDNSSTRLIDNLRAKGNKRSPLPTNPRGNEPPHSCGRGRRSPPDPPPPNKTRNPAKGETPLHPKVRGVPHPRHPPGQRGPLSIDLVSPVPITFGTYGTNSSPPTVQKAGGAREISSLPTGPYSFTRLRKMSCSSGSTSYPLKGGLEGRRYCGERRGVKTHVGTRVTRTATTCGGPGLNVESATGSHEL